MATGGARAARTSRSDPVKRSGQRLDSEERSSIGSSRHEDRPNNWEFSDWQPSSAYDSGKRIKKGNEEKERERGQSQEGGAGAVASSSGQGGDARSRHKTPSTFPRTKMTSATPLVERLALQNLRQQLVFSDTEEGADGGEKNNERFATRRGAGAAVQDAGPPGTRNDVAASGGGDNNRDNRNISKDDGPDSTQIVGRLMQIRDYIKQATSMMDGLKRSTDPGDLGRARQLDQVVRRLKEQEQKYLDILLRLSAQGAQVERLNSLLNHLQEQEFTYVGYLKQLLGVNDFDELLRPSSSSAGGAADEESESEAASLDLDVASDTSSNTTDDNEDQRPVIEEHLGRHSDTELDDPSSARSSKTTDTLQSDPDVTVVARQRPSPQQQQGNSTPSPRLRETSQRLENDLMKKNDELEALRQQHDLLKKMLNQQEQLRALQGRQEALLAIQRDAENRLRQERSNNEANAPEIAAVSTANVEASPGAAAAADAESVPRELKDLRRHLNYLKNIYEIKDSASGPSESAAESEDASVATSVMSVHRHHLEDKLSELQHKRHQMEDLMTELKQLRREQKHQMQGVLHNELDGGSTSSSQAHVMDGLAASQSAAHTAQDAGDVLALLQTRKKLKKLQDVRARLNQLRDLVQYYQRGAEFIHDEDASLPPPEQNLYAAAAAAAASNIREVKPRDSVASRLQRYAEGDTSQDTSRRGSESGGGATDTESQASSFAAWGDDPDVRDKASKLKQAKEKLRRLQDLVALVQQSPDNGLPSDLAELASGFDSDILSELAELSQAEPAQQQPRRSPGGGAAGTRAVGTSSAAGEPSQNSPSLAMSAEEREAFYKLRMLRQRQELEQLVEERRKLLAIQDQLQRLHDQLPAGGESNDADTDGGTAPQDDNTQLKAVSEGAQVTFQEPLATVASYDELYGKMRQHRMLREELREKKKELEFMMKKDRPRKHYFRNQDNQSDNISFSNKSDPFGTQSGDVTVATWGGSTADNMGSIEEDENDSGAGQEADDGYPVDGLLQVEEEEEEAVAADDDDSDSDGRDTYTVENERFPRDAADGKRNVGGAPLLNQHGARVRGRYQYNCWSPNDDNILNNARTNQARPPTRRKQQNLATAEDLAEGGALGGDGGVHEEVNRLRQQLRETRSLVHGMQGYGGGSGAPWMSQMATQVQQQQLLLCQQVLAQQQENAERLRRLEVAVLPAVGTPSPYSAVSSAPSVPLLTTHPPPSAPPTLRPFHFQPRPTVTNTVRSGRPFAADSADGALYNPSSDGLGDAAHNITVTVNNTLNRAGRVVQQGQGARAVGAVGSRAPPGAAPSPERGRPYRVEDVVPIETIQASDQRVPPLDLNALQHNHRHRLEDMSGSSPGRLAAAAQLASRQQQQAALASSYRPGLSADISGTAYDTISMSSYVSSMLGDAQQAQLGVNAAETASVSSATRHQINIIESHEPRSQFALFEALRETIYSEVATLISQNENRPHFLIELFRELQMLSNDYLRQRALYSIQDLVTRHLTDDQRTPDKRPVGDNASELTPSESLFTTDDERGKVVSRTAQGGAAAAARRERFDYAEQVDTLSSMSTPNSTAELSNPFAKEPLGDTVIHLDKALHRMREYERRLVETRGAEVGGAHKLSDATSSSAQDLVSDADSVSDVPYPRIDTQQLDTQIKGVMTQVIPVLKEHMDALCSAPLLQYVRRLVLSLTRHRDDTHEFVRFFHKQLESILHDSLAKFEGRKMRECSEDLLVELSEILFNELAFFRLMQDLDGPKRRTKQQLRHWRQSFQESESGADEEAGAGPVRAARRVNMVTSESEVLTESESELSEVQHTARRVQPQDREEDFSGVDVVSEEGDEEETSSSDQEEDEDDAESSGSESGEDEPPAPPAASEQEHEELGKARDDEFARRTEMRDEGDSDAAGVKFELAQSELKSFNRIGSDEDDEGAEDEAVSNGDPSETAVSRDAQNETRDARTEHAAAAGSEPAAGSDDDAEQDEFDTPDRPTDEVVELSNENTQNQPETNEKEAPSPVTDSVADVVTKVNEPEPEAETEGDTLEAEEGDTPVANHVNGAQVNGHDENAAGELTLNDLPAKLSGLSKDSLSGVAEQMAQETQDNIAALHAETVGTATDAPLAGDDDAVRKPPEEDDDDEYEYESEDESDDSDASEEDGVAVEVDAETEEEEEEENEEEKKSEEEESAESVSSDSSGSEDEEDHEKTVLYRSPEGGTS